MSDQPLSEAAFLSGPAHRHRTTIAQRLLLTIGALLAAVLLIAGFSQWLFLDQVDRLRDSYHLSRELNSNIRRMAEAMNEQESGLRGYLITQDEELLQPFYEGRAQYLSALEQTRQVTRAIALRLNQQEPVSEMERLLDRVGEAAENWYEFVRTSEIGPVRRGRPEQALSVVRNRQGKVRFDNFRKAANEVRLQNDRLFAQLEAHSTERQRQIEWLAIVLIVFAGLGSLVVALRLVRDLRRPLLALEQAAEALGQGNLAVRVDRQVLRHNDELAVFAQTFDQMAARLQRQTMQLRERDILEGLRSIDLVLVEEIDLDRLCERLLLSLASLVDAQIGAVYLLKDDLLHLYAGYGLSTPATQVRPGEGLVGLAASQRRPVIVEGSAVAEERRLETPVGALQLQCLSAWPLVSNQQLVGVLFLGGLQPLTPQSRNLLESVSSRLAIALLNSRSIRTSEEALARLEATFTQMSDGVLLADVAGVTQAVNPAGRRILGLAPEDDLGDPQLRKRFGVLATAGAALENHGAPVQQALRTGTTVRGDLQLQLANGALVQLSVSASPLKDQRGRIFGAVAVFRDVTTERERERRLAEQAATLEHLNEELRSANEELEKQRAELETINEEIERQRAQIEVQNRELIEADRQKNDFLASMSHELRTPLNAIIGFSQLLMRHQHLQQQPQILLQLERIYENGKVQLRLVNDILDLAKIKSGKLELQYRPLDLEPFLREILASLESLALQKQLAVKVEIDPDVGTIETDARHLRTVITNLLSNAFKYTERGEVRLIARRLPEGSIEVQVQDTGIGIAPEQQRKVFDEFSRLEGASTRQTTGTGLGLAICHRLVEALGGEIGLASVPGRGSIFTVRLPDGLGFRGRRAKVLFVEDDPQVQQLIATHLADCPYQLLFAPDSIEGLQIARSERPDAIVLDPLLPHTDLWKVLLELRTDPAIATTPVYLQGMLGDRELAMPVEHADFLARPVGQESLLALLHQRQIAPGRGPILLLDADRPERQVLADCLQDEGYRLQLAKTAAEALTLLDSHLPQLVIVDLSLPHLAGFEVLCRVRKMPGGRQLPVIILGTLAQDRPRHRWQAAERMAGKSDHRLDELMGLLAESLRREHAS